MAPGEPNFGFADDLALPCHRRLDVKGKRGFGDVYTRVHPDRPAPTITTRFHSVSNGRFGHYEQDRGLSLHEGALLQSFPPGYEFHAEGMDTAARMIGNAVPPKLAECLARHLYDAWREEQSLPADATRGRPTMNSKELCLRILSAESEDAVSAIIDEVPELSDPANWHPVDGRETNFNVVTNQASTGSKALTELCTNMVDAMLLKHAHLDGIVPAGPDAPQSVTDAVRDLVRLKGARSGVLAEVDDEKYLREFAEKNLVIGITGSTRRGESLCFTFTDNGEGQHPDDFEDTFLSLSKGNKSNIPSYRASTTWGRPAC